MKKFYSLLWTSLACLLVACSPEDRIKTYMDDARNTFVTSDSCAELVSDSLYLYPVNAPNYLSDENVLQCALYYAEYRMDDGKQESDRFAKLRGLPPDSIEKMITEVIRQVRPESWTLPKGGVWALQEVVYKKTVAGKTAEKLHNGYWLYLFNDVGTAVEQQWVVDFNHEIFEKMLDIAETPYLPNYERWFYLIGIGYLLIAVAVLVVISVVYRLKQRKKRREKQLKKSSSRPAP